MAYSYFGVGAQPPPRYVPPPQYNSWNPPPRTPPPDWNTAYNNSQNRSEPVPQSVPRDLRPNAMTVAGGPGANGQMGFDASGMNIFERTKQLVDQGILPPSALFRTVNLDQPKVPGMGLETIGSETAAAVSGFKMPSFDEYKKQAENLTASYDTATKALDPTDYINKLEGADLNARNVITPRYVASQEAMLANEKANTLNAQNQANLIAERGIAAESRRQSGAGGGAGSEGAAMYARATLPDILAANERSSARYSNALDTSGRNIANWTLGDEQRTKETAGLIQNVLQSNSQQQIQLARQRFVDLGMPEREFNAMLQAVQSGKLSLIAAAADISQRYGREGFIMSPEQVAQTGQPNPVTPRYPSNNPGQPNNARPDVTNNYYVEGGPNQNPQGQTQGPQTPTYGSAEWAHNLYLENQKKLGLG